jgi:hypothetical protein
LKLYGRGYGTGVRDILVGRRPRQDRLEGLDDRSDGLRLLFVSYENDYLIWYAGWQGSGFFSFKFDIKKSPIQFGELGSRRCDGR